MDSQPVFQYLHIPRSSSFRKSFLTHVTVVDTASDLKTVFTTYLIPMWHRLRVQSTPSGQGHAQPVVPTSFILGSSSNLSWEPGACLGPCLRRAAVVRLPIWVTSTGKATRGRPVYMLAHHNSCREVRWMEVEVGKWEWD